MLLGAFQSLHIVFHCGEQTIYIGHSMQSNAGSAFFMPVSKFPITFSRYEKIYGARGFMRTANKLSLGKCAIILVWGWEVWLD